jgi:hypothetical protein
MAESPVNSDRFAALETPEPGGDGSEASPVCPMPHDHDLAAELLPKNIIWGDFLRRAANSMANADFTF